MIGVLLPLAGCFEQGDRLIINKAPNKTVYNVNEAFSLEGIDVIDNHGNQIEDYVSSISNGTSLKKEGIRKVEISKESYKSAFFKIEVKKLDSLVVKHLPNKTEYTVGEYFNIDGLVITNQDDVPIGNYTLSYRIGDAFLSAGEKTITVSKENYVSTSFKVTVENALALTIEHMPNKTTYEVGDAFDSTGLVVGDTKGRSISNYSLSIKNGEILKYPGDIKVEIMADGYDNKSFNIKVNEKVNPIGDIEKTVKVFYINDTHGSFIRSENDNEAGMAYIGEYLKRQKQENEYSLILSGGDMFQGGCESNDTRGKIMIDAMNDIGFDAMALGNHEFDWGEEAIRTNSSYMNFPLLSCNTFYEYEDGVRPNWVEPYTIVEKNDLKIGIIGYAKQDLGSSIDEEFAADFEWPNPVSYIEEYASVLRFSYNCDLVLTVGHDPGIDYESDAYGSDYYDLANNYTDTNVRKVDGFCFAHDHIAKQGKIQSSPYLESGSNGKNVGIMTFNLKSTDGVSYKVENASTSILNGMRTCTNEDTTISGLVDTYRDQFLADPDSVLRTFNRSFSKTQFTKVICQAMVWYLNDNPNTFDNKTVYIGSHNTGGVRVDSVSSGRFTYRDLVKTYPFDNKLCLEKCNERNVNAILGNSNPTWELSEPVYTNGYTYCVTISYIAGKSYARAQYTSYEPYEQTAKLALIRFLQSGEAINV